MYVFFVFYIIAISYYIYVHVKGNNITSWFYIIAAGTLVTFILVAFWVKKYCAHVVYLK